MDAKEAISACTTDPEKLRELEPALFEAVVAELLAGFGWEVSVTPPTRDGGYDILGLTIDPSGLQRTAAPPPLNRSVRTTRMPSATAS